MKKIILLAFIALSVYCQAQKVTDKKNAVKFDPAGFIIPETGLVIYERGLHNKQSVLIKASYSAYSRGSYKYSGVSGGAEYRFYFGNNAADLKGFHAGPSLAFGSGKSKSGASSSTYSDVVALVIAGKQWIWEKGFLLNLHLGAGYYSYKYKDNGNPLFGKDNIKGLGLDFGVCIGYAF
jgi:hypothetical protein